MFGYRSESNGFTRGKCIRLYAGYSNQIKSNQLLLTSKQYIHSINA